MNIEEIILGSNIGAEPKKRNLRILHIYKELSVAQLETTSKAGIFCKEGCGECCLRQEPQITPIEGEFIALLLMAQKWDLNVYFDSLALRSHCIFYNPDSTHHCKIYEMRPLLCRIFHYCTYRNKFGIPEYQPCFIMRETLKIVTSENLPISEDYGRALAALDPDGGVSLLPVSESVFNAYQKLRYLDSLQSNRNSC